MHTWGDEWFEKHGENLSRAMTLISSYLYLHSPYSLSMKEKYGTIRYEFLTASTSTRSFEAHEKAREILREAVALAVGVWPELEVEITEDFNNGEDL